MSGLVAWILRAAFQALRDAANVERAPSLYLPQFFFRRLRGAPPPSARSEVEDILDWHARWYPYAAAGIALAAIALVCVIVVRRAAAGHRGGPRPDIAAILARYS